MEKEWFEKLTDEQKAKLRGLDGDADKLIAFCKEEKLDLPDDLLEAVSGGMPIGSHGPCPALRCGEHS